MGLRGDYLTFIIHLQAPLAIAHLKRAHILHASGDARQRGKISHHYVKNKFNISNTEYRILCHKPEGQVLLSSI